MTGTPTTTSQGPRLGNYAGELLRSGYAYGDLAPGVAGLERLERLGGLGEVVGPLDGDLKRPVGEVPRYAPEGLG